MEKDKTRGIKHIKDKKKYKANSAKNDKYMPPKTKPNLESNWDRYEIDEVSEHEHKLSSNTDFAVLSNLPISTGSHFQFKNDKVEEEVNTEKTNLFCLNLELLQQSILTIPFYKRLCIERDYFEENEIDMMDKEAQKNLSIYKKLTESKTVPGNVIPDLDSVDTVPEQPQDIPIKESDILELIDNCNIEEENKVTAEQQAQVGDDSEQDLEQWLDDILED